MGTISAGIGLISGIDSASLIEQLLAIERQPILRVQARIANVRQQQTALLDVNSRLLNFKNASAAFRRDNVFRATSATASR